MKKYGQYAESPKTRATHGLTVGDLDDLLEEQKHEDVTKIKCNLNPDHEIPLVEAHAFYHVMLEAPLFDTQTGVRLSTPKKRKFHVRQYNHMLKNHFFNGQQVEVLHNPLKYNEDKERQTLDEPDPETTDPGTDPAKASPEGDDKIPTIKLD